jgi:hypothetical protein
MADTEAIASRLHEFIQAAKRKASTSGLQTQVSVQPAAVTVTAPRLRK